MTTDLVDQLAELRAFREDRARFRRRARYRMRRLGLAAGLVLLVTGALLIARPSAHTDFTAPTRSALAGLSVGERIVKVASSQLGYGTDPTRSYCNKFSFGWRVGGTGCPPDERSEEWCADFAAWAWRRAGVAFSYGYGTGEIDAGAASFYEWGLATGRWHSAASRFRASPGDVAVYGLKLSGTPTAAHVAIVTGDPRGQAGPDVINGDGDRTGFSVVETGTDQSRADTGRGGGAPLAGYVSPTG